jgi:FKBP-type peptidyl-prolyl cis-trans isomerase 2
VSVELQPIVIEPVQEARSATAGHTVSYLVTVVNRGVTERTFHVEVDGIATGRSSEAAVASNSSLALFVPVDIPANAPEGVHGLTVRVVSGDRILRARDNAVSLTILPEAPGVQVGDRAEVRYLGRLADTGRAFASNEQALVGAPFLKTDAYQYNPAMLPVSTEPRNVVLGIYEGILGMQPGETRTLTFGFEKGYGPPSENDTVPRREVIERTLAAHNDVQRVPRATFDDYIVETRQGDPATYGLNSTFTLDDDQNVWPYRIVTFNEQLVEYKLAAKVGDTFTLYPYWPQGTEIIEIDEEDVVFFTTPTTAPAPEGTCPPRQGGAGSDCFTMRQEWPEMSTLDAEPNATHIVVRHDPPAQYRYTTAQSGQTREVVVAALGEDEITVAVAAQHPLAGRTLTFDITVVSVTKKA